jgi:hypothetical protein
MRQEFKAITSKDCRLLSPVVNLFLLLLLWQPTIAHAEFCLGPLGCWGQKTPDPWATAEVKAWVNEGAVKGWIAEGAFTAKAIMESGAAQAWVAEGAVKGYIENGAIRSEILVTLLPKEFAAVTVPGISIICLTQLAAIILNQIRFQELGVLKSIGLVSGFSLVPTVALYAPQLFQLAHSSRSPSKQNRVVHVPTINTLQENHVMPNTALGPRAVGELTWELVNKAEAKTTFKQAEEYCANLGGEWRLPTVWELYVLHLQKSVLGTNLVKGKVWSLTGSQDNHRWVVGLADGEISDSYHGTLKAQVRCVINRNPDSPPPQVEKVAHTQPAINVDPLAMAPNWYFGSRDSVNVAALEWELGRKSASPMNFKEAQTYAASRSAAGWRLPTIWELSALYQQKEAISSDLVADDLVTDYFWSDAAIANSPGFHWTFGFTYGHLSAARNDGKFQVRLVRTISNP